MALTPGPEVWRWHAVLLQELAAVHGDMENYVERLSYIAEYNLEYDPDMLAERAWPLMKLGRFDAARLAAREGMAEGSPRQMEIGLNALCAVEFEAGHDGNSYDACRAALDYARREGRPSTVDLTNFAEASRSVFKLDEAERILLEATEAEVSWYGNPWLDLGELYTRQGRFAEALNALRRVPPYRSKRPAHVREADRNEGRRALSAFFTVVGRPVEALHITEKALVAPDRRGHNSRDPAQDGAIIALLDRRARLLQAEMVREQAAASPWYERLGAWAQASWLGVEAWMSGRQATRLLAGLDGGGRDRLVGVFRIGTAEAAVVPPWLLGDLVDVAGAGVVREAVRRARARDEREQAEGYYDAFAAEAALASGDEERALELGARATAALGQQEVMLVARVRALMAEAAWRSGQDATAHYDAAFQRDPGVFRRLGFTVPVRIEVSGDDVAEAVGDALGRSPRLDDGGAGLRVVVEADATGGRACLLGVGAAVLGCGDATPEPADSVDEFAQRIADAFHTAVFAPRIDLSQADANSLDGSHAVERDPLRTLFD